LLLLIAVSYKIVTFAIIKKLFMFSFKLCISLSPVLFTDIFVHVYDVADVPYRFQYQDTISSNGSILLQYDSRTSSSSLVALLHMGWFNRRFSAVVLEYNIYTAYSDLITQV
jgi:hypothetical protein